MSRAREFKAGKYMLAETGEKKAAQEAMKTMNFFCPLEKMLCCGPANDVVVTVRCTFFGDLSLSYAVAVL
jgi:hypothetical protein